MKNLQVALGKLLTIRRAIASRAIDIANRDNETFILHEIDCVRALLEVTRKDSVLAESADVGNSKSITLEKKPDGRYVVVRPKV